MAARGNGRRTSSGDPLADRTRPQNQSSPTSRSDVSITTIRPARFSLVNEIGGRDGVTSGGRGVGGGGGTVGAAPSRGTNASHGELIPENNIMVKVGRWTSIYVHALHGTRRPGTNFRKTSVKNGRGRPRMSTSTPASAPFKYWTRRYPTVLNQP